MPLPHAPTLAAMEKSLGVILAQLAMAVAVGMLTAFQPGVNRKFGEVSGAPLHGGVISFAVGLATVLLVAVILRASPPPISRVALGPVWMWVGGVIGAVFVTAAIYLSKPMGQGNYMAAMIAGQLVAGVVIDHFGFMGYDRHPFSVARAGGLVLIGLGVALLRLK